MWRGEDRPGALRKDVFRGVSDAVGRTSFFQGQSQSCEGFDISSGFFVGKPFMAGWNPTKIFGGGRETRILAVS